MERREVKVPISWTPDDLRLIEECLNVVANNLSNELEPGMRAFVRRRCREVGLKVQDFVVEAQHLTREQADVDYPGVGPNSFGSCLDRAVFGEKRQE